MCLKLKNCIILMVQAIIIGDITSAKKQLINGLNGGLGTGVNGVNPLLVGGLNPPVLSGGAMVIGQPPLTQFLPAAAHPPYPYVLQQSPVASVPPPPNIGPQLAYPFAPSNGPGQDPTGNNQAVPLGSLNRFKRSFLRSTTLRPPVSITQMPAQVSPTVSGHFSERCAL